MGDGASSLTIPIAQALPKPPDVAAEGAVPGGVLVPCTPLSPALPVVNRNEWRLQFAFTQGFALTVRRIHVALPVFLAERELEKETQEEITRKRYGTEVERNAEATRISGETEETKDAIGYAAPYQRRASIVAAVAEGAGTVLKLITTTVTERSILPITVQVIARLTGPDGHLWSQSFDVPVHYVTGEAGKAGGIGLIDSYIDLNNGIPIDPSKQYGLQLLMLIPSAVPTNTQLGIEILGGVPTFGNGEVTFFYDLETAPIGK